MERVIAEFAERRYLQFTQSANECMLRLLSRWGRNLELSHGKAGELTIYVSENFKVNKSLRGDLLVTIAENEDLLKDEGAVLTTKIVFSLYSDIIVSIFRGLNKKKELTDYDIIEYLLSTRQEKIFDIDRVLYKSIIAPMREEATPLIDEIFKDCPPRTPTFDSTLSYVSDKVTEKIKSSPFKARYLRSMVAFANEELKAAIIKNLHVDIVEQVKTTEADVLTIYDLYMIIQNSESFPLICDIDLYTE